MLSELPYSCLKKEIHFLRLDLNRLSFELNVQEMYHTFYNPAVANMIERQRALFHWKKTRLEALELFAHAQLVITEMEPPKQPAFTRTYKRKRRPKKNVHATGPSQDPKYHSTPQNVVQMDSNKENQGPASQVGTITNIKVEDSKENMAQSIADVLKNMKKEKIDYDENSVLNNNIDTNFIPQLIPVANIKTEVDCTHSQE